MQRHFCDQLGIGGSTLRLWKSGGYLLDHERMRIVEVLNRVLKAKGKPTITVEWLFQDWQLRPPANKHVNPSQARPPLQVQPQRFTIELDDIDLPDLLTPGPATTQIRQIYEPQIGAQLAETLQEHSTNAILAVENGDFGAQSTIGVQIAEEAAEFPNIRGVGLYFSGEGLRLSADLERNPSKRANLYRQAAGKYYEASQLLPSDPRPIRGIARIKEREDLFDEAMEGFSRAEGLVLVSKFRRGVSYRKPFLDHEYLRVIRHKMHCLFDLREKSPNNVWNREHKRQELYGLVVRCDNLHHELMGSFNGRRRWWQIEWFMGLVFLAKAWGSLRQGDRMFVCLLHALSFRRSMFADSKVLNDIERSNLKWWVEVALLFRDLLTKQFVRSVEQLQAALFENNDVAVLVRVDDLVREIRPPGEKSF